MSLDYGLFQTLHRMLRQLTDLKDRINRGPMKIRAVEANEKSFAESLAECDAAVDEVRRSSNDKQMQLAEREAKIEDMKGKLNTCDSNKEFQLLKDRIAADEQANSVLQDEILELLERLDELQAQQQEARKNYEKAQSDTQAMKDRVKLELQELRAEQERVTGELAETEKGIPTLLLDNYRRLVKNKGEDAFATTNRETCDNCNQQLTTQMASNLMMKQAVICSGCGSILYVKE